MKMFLWENILVDLNAKLKLKLSGTLKKNCQSYSAPRQALYHKSKFIRFEAYFFFPEKNQGGGEWGEISDTSLFTLY